MKKSVVLFLTLIMVLSFCGCGNDVAPKKGTIEGSVYTSETAGITVTIPEGWEFYSEEEINQLYSSGAGEQEEANTIYDMMCVNMTEGSSINLVYENLNSLYGAILSEEAYIEAAISNLEETLGDAILSADAATVKVDGTTFNCIKIVMDYSTVTLNQTMLIKKAGNYRYNSWLL